MSRVNAGLGCLLLVALGLIGCTANPPATSNDGGGSAASGADGERLKVAFVTNQIASFWNIAKVGCEDGAKEFDVDCDVRMPPNATAVEQKRIVEDLLAGGVQAVAISPIDADNQVALC